MAAAMKQVKLEYGQVRGVKRELARELVEEMDVSEPRSQSPRLVIDESGANAAVKKEEDI